MVPPRSRRARCNREATAALRASLIEIAAEL
jgi:hypothetical protein